MRPAEASDASGSPSTVRAWHHALQPGMEIVDTRFPKPADLAYVVRRARKPRNAAIETLIAEIEGEISRYGTLQIAV